MISAIAIENLGMVFRTNWGTKKRALENLSLEVKQNEIFGFLGHNGAGKTTTIKILVGLCHSTEGKAEILGIPVRNKDARNNIGYLPENVSFYEYLTGFETVEFYGKLRGFPKDQCRARALAMLEEVGLKEAVSRRVAEYSKGMKQRLGLAQAMIHDPKILILDEPLTGLDPSGRKEMREKIRLLRDAGKTVFFSSHVLSDVELLCDRVALLTRGKLIAVGHVDELLGARITGIEIVGKALSENALTAIRPFVKRMFTEGDKTAIWVEDEQSAGQVQKIIAECGGELKALVPHRETLEDFYFRQELKYKEAQP